MTALLLHREQWGMAPALTSGKKENMQPTVTTQCGKCYKMCSWCTGGAPGTLQSLISSAWAGVEEGGREQTVQRRWCLSWPFKDDWKLTGQEARAEATARSKAGKQCELGKSNWSTRASRRGDQGQREAWKGTRGCVMDWTPSRTPLNWEVTSVKL